ncbi:MAG TPA: HD domain-containing phosphohydrolase [Steroidobacteraceae bacterium]|nr:HD domain-containing phosphohydrolase [Steroidobacteraceae bacterium]
MSNKPRVLFVDDDLRLLQAFAAALGDQFAVETAIGGQAGLRKMREHADLAVVVSDLGMPQMDGATFLHESMQQSPTATRILLTGLGGIDGAKNAVNKGQIFRFLTKPCPLDQLRQALEDGVEHHRLMQAERTLMQETLIECIAALMEVLAITNPIAFGRAQRVKSVVQELANRLECSGFWQLEGAALLSQIGYFAVDAQLAEKIYYGRPLSPEEQSCAAAVPRHARRLLEHIPRLEPVLQILAALEWTDAQLVRAGERMVGLGARILCAALEYDMQTIKGTERLEILDAMRDHEARYGARVLDALADFAGAAAQAQELLHISLRHATPGMRLRQEIRSSTGALLVPIGIEISAHLIDRLAQIAPDLLDQPVRVAPAPKD